MPPNQFKSKYQSQKSNLVPLIQPQSVSLIGASSTRLNPGLVLLNKYQSAGCDTYAVNMKQVPSHTTFTSIADLPKSDLLIISVPHDQVMSTLQQAISLDKMRAVQVISAGFEETGDHSLQQISQTLNFPLQGSNCVGNVSSGNDLTFFKGYKQPLHRMNLHSENLGQELFSNISVVSQSGAFLSSVGQNVPLNFGFSVGNQSQIKVSDYIEFCCRKEQKVIVSYVEVVNKAEYQKIEKIIQDNKDVKFVFYQGVRSQKALKQAEAHSGSAEDNVQLTELKYDNCKVLKTINEVESFCQIHQAKVLENKVLALTQSGYIATIFSNYLQFDTLTENQTKQLNLIFRNIPVKIGPNLDATPILTVPNLMKTLDVLLQGDQKVVFSILPELYDEEEIRIIKDKLHSLKLNEKQKMTVIVENSHALTEEIKQLGFNTIYRADSLGIK
ncbi:Acetyl-CoA_synthetase [Hexamita inflata]|uniref:Acetyl-CoA synthetase n=1 Tax=Hexamita inflata TaxID=28002 RepID=A0AA86R1A5_9EUKA|nr:Acetyl-CoA synthetase [Hexamita inflata]